MRHTCGTAIALRNDVNTEDLRNAVASDILGYITGREHATDTLENIRIWWIPRQRYEEASSLVQEALDWLVQEQYLVDDERSEGKRYSLVENKFPEIEIFLADTKILRLKRLMS